MWWYRFKMHDECIITMTIDISIIMLLLMYLSHLAIPNLLSSPHLLVKLMAIPYTYYPVMI